VGCAVGFKRQWLEDVRNGWQIGILRRFPACRSLGCSNSRLRWQVDIRASQCADYRDDPSQQLTGLPRSQGKSVRAPAVSFCQAAWLLLLISSAYEVFAETVYMQHTMTLQTQLSVDRRQLIMHSDLLLTTYDVTNSTLSTTQGKHSRWLLPRLFTLQPGVYNDIGITAADSSSHAWNFCLRATTSQTVIYTGQAFIVISDWIVYSQELQRHKLCTRGNLLPPNNINACSSNRNILLKTLTKTVHHKSSP